MLKIVKSNIFQNLDFRIFLSVIFGHLSVRNQAMQLQRPNRAHHSRANNNSEKGS